MNNERQARAYLKRLARQARAKARRERYQPRYDSPAARDLLEALLESDEDAEIRRIKEGRPCTCPLCRDLPQLNELPTQRGTDR